MAKGIRDQRYRNLIGKLVEARSAGGLSQEALGRRLKTHQQFVSRYETGERRLDVIEFIDVCTALDVSAADLLQAL